MNLNSVQQQENQLSNKSLFERYAQTIEKNMSYFDTKKGKNPKVSIL